jgi:hypothetical protein
MGKKKDAKKAIKSLEKAAAKGLAPGDAGEVSKRIKKAEKASLKAHLAPKEKGKWATDRKLEKELKRVFGKALKASVFSISTDEPRVAFDGARKRGKAVPASPLAVDVLRDCLYKRLQALPSAE